MTIEVLDRQTIWDIAIQVYGSVEGIFALFADNNITPELNADLTARQILNILSPPTNANNLNYYNNNKCKPITAPTIPASQFNGDFNDDYSDDFFIEMQ